MVGMPLSSAGLHILLPEDMSRVKTAKDPVRGGGDILKGCLVAQGDNSPDFEVDVDFEGAIRTWISGDATDVSSLSAASRLAEYSFFQERQRIRVIRRDTGETGVNISHCGRFAFVLPHRLISPQSNVSDIFLDLLPSTTRGIRHYDSKSRKFFAQPLVAYTLTATRTGVDFRLRSAKCNRCEREVAIMPSTAGMPPLQIESFPGEYSVICAKQLKRYMWSRPVGDLIVSSEEPAPLNIATSASRATTSVPIKLVFTSFERTPSIPPWEWTMRVQSLLRVRTFWTTDRFLKIPTMMSRYYGPSFDVSSSLIPLEVRQLETHSWRSQHLSMDGTILPDTDSFTWTSRIVVPINAPTTLIPTFHSPLADQRYALVLHIRTGAFHRRKFLLELPVQVVYDSSVDQTVLYSTEDDGEGIHITPDLPFDGSNIQESPEVKNPPSYAGD